MGFPICKGAVAEMPPPPLHPYGPNIGPCTGHFCRYCKRLEMDIEAAQREISELWNQLRHERRTVDELRKENCRLQAANKVLDRRLDMALDQIHGH